MDATIKIEKYNPIWVERFKVERRLLESSIGNFICGSIEHVGSTAVIGLKAKPIVDIMVGVETLDASKPAISILTKLGYCHSPYKADVMHWFCKPSSQFRTHHLHLVPYQSDLWKDRIKFRNILRADKDIAKKYEVLKLDLAGKYKSDRDRYTQEKWPFIESVLFT